MPMSRFAAGTATTSLPSTETEPASAVSNPARMRSAVVLPQPEGPSSATNSPGAISSDSRSSARTVPNVLAEARHDDGNAAASPGRQRQRAASAALVVFAVIGILQSLGGRR